MDRRCAGFCKECVLAIHFGLAEDEKATAKQLVAMLRNNEMKLQTGFVGTPYLLHALSKHGYIQEAYDLLLRTEYPSWLYPVTKGATTIWEHWDGIKENGDMWSSAMNSFNHYAFGSVIDWVYTVSAGIQTCEETPGYQKIRIAPMPDERLDWLSATVDTRQGKVFSSWSKQGDMWHYEVSTPVEACIVIEGKEYLKQAGSYHFYSPILK